MEMKQVCLFTLMHWFVCFLNTTFFGPWSPGQGTVMHLHWWNIFLWIWCYNKFYSKNLFTVVAEDPGGCLSWLLFLLLTFLTVHYKKASRTGDEMTTAKLTLWIDLWRASFLTDCEKLSMYFISQTNKNKLDSSTNMSGRWGGTWFYPLLPLWL